MSNGLCAWLPFGLPPPGTQDNSQLQEIEPLLTVGSQVGGSHGEKLPKGSSPRSKFNVFLQAPGLSLALSTASSSKSPCASSRPGGGAPREAQGGDNPEISGTPHFPPDCLSTEPRQSFRGPNRGRKELFSPLAGEQEPHQGGGAYVAREVQTAIMAHQTVCQPVAVVAEDEAREENMDGGDAAFLLSKASEPDVPPTQQLEIPPTQLLDAETVPVSCNTALPSYPRLTGAKLAVPESRKMDDGGDCSISTAAGGTALSPCASGAAPCELGCPGDGFAVKAAGSSGDPDQQEAALHPVVCTSEEAMLMAETIPESFIRVPSKMSAVPDSEEITDDICPSSPPHHISHPQGDIGEGQHGNSISPVHHEGGEKAPLTMSAAAAGQAGFKGHGAAGDSSTRRADSCAVLSSPPKREPMEAGNKPRPLSCRRLSALPATLPQQINSGPAEGPGQQPTAVAEVSEREPQGDFCHDERNSGAPVAGPSRLVESPTGCPAPSRQRRPAGDVAPGMKLTKTEIDATANETREFFDALLKLDGDPVKVLSFAVIDSEMEAVMAAACSPGREVDDAECARWQGLLWLLRVRHGLDLEFASGPGGGDSGAVGEEEDMTMLEGTDDAWLADEIRSDEELAALATEWKLQATEAAHWWSQRSLQSGGRALSTSCQPGQLLFFSQQLDASLAARLTQSGARRKSSSQPPLPAFATGRGAPLLAMQGNVGKSPSSRALLESDPSKVRGPRLEESEMSGTEVACAGADADATGCFGGSSAARVASLGADVVGDAGGNAGAGVTVIGDVGGGEAVEGTAGANDLNQDPTAPPERVQEADEGGHPVLGVSGRGRSQSAKGTTPTASAVGEAKPDDVENDAGETAWESLEERIRAGGCNGEEIHCGADPLTAAAGEGSEDVDRLGAQKDRMTGYPTSVTAALGMSSNLQRRLHRFKQNPRPVREAEEYRNPERPADKSTAGHAEAVAPGKGSAAAEREASQECRALSEGVSGRQEQAAWESGSAEPEMVPCTLEGVKDLAVPNQAPVSVPRHDKVTGILHGVQASQEVLTGTDAQDQVRAEPPSPSLRGMVDDERLSEDEGNGVQDATQEAAPRSPPPLQLVLESQLELSPTAAEELAGLRREIAADLEVQPGGGDEPTPGALCISADLVPDSAPPSPLAASPRLDERPNERLPLLTPRDGAEPWKQPVPVSGGLARARRQVPSPKAVDFTGAQAAEGAGPGQHGSPGASHALLKGSGDRFGDPMPSRSPGPHKPVHSMGPASPQAVSPTLSDPMTSFVSATDPPGPGSMSANRPIQSQDGEEPFMEMTPGFDTAFCFREQHQPKLQTRVSGISTLLEGTGLEKEALPPPSREPARRLNPSSTRAQGGLAGWSAAAAQVAATLTAHQRSMAAVIRGNAAGRSSYKDEYSFPDSDQISNAQPDAPGGTAGKESSAGAEEAEELEDIRVAPPSTRQKESNKVALPPLQNGAVVAASQHSAKQIGRDAAGTGSSKTPTAAKTGHGFRLLRPCSTRGYKMVEMHNLLVAERFGKVQTAPRAVAKNKQSQQKQVPVQRSSRTRRPPKRFDEEDRNKEDGDGDGKRLARRDTPSRKDQPPPNKRANLRATAANRIAARKACEAAQPQQKAQLRGAPAAPTAIPSLRERSRRNLNGCSKCSWSKMGCATCHRGSGGDGAEDAAGRQAEMKGARENLAEERRGPKKDEDEDERLEGGIVCPAGKRRRKSGAVLWTQEQSKAVISSASPIRARGRGTCSLQASSFLLTGLERQARTKAAEAIRLLGGKEMDKVPPPPTAIAHSRGSNSKVLRFQQDVVVVTPLIKDSKEPKTTFKYLCGIAMGCKIVTPEWLQEAARSGSASSSRHVVSKGRGTDRCCLAGLHFHLAGDSQWKATFSEVLKHAGAIPMPLPDDSKAQGESIIVVANPFQLVNQHNADLTARTARQLLHNGVQLVPGEWVLQALRTNAVPPLPPPPEGLEAAASRAKATLEAAARLNRAPGLPSHKEAEDAQECKPRESMDRKRKASAIAEEEETKRRPPAAGQAAPDNRRGPADAARDVWNGHHSGEGLSWVGETTEPPPELSHMRGHFRSFYNAFRSTALGCKICVGDCVEVEAGPRERQVVRVSALWEESTRGGGRQLMRAERFYSPQDTIFPESGLPDGFDGELFASGHTHDALSLQALVKRVEVVMAPPGQKLEGRGGGSSHAKSITRYICRYFYDHMQQGLRAL